jgi:hypothetical protein
LLALTALTGLLAQPTLAQQERWDVEAGADIGYFFFEEKVEDDLGWGVRLGLAITKPFEIELAYDRIDTEDDLGLGLDAESDYLSVDFLWNFHPGAWYGGGRHVPFALLGVGRIDGRATIGPLSFEKKADMIKGGVGYRYYMTEHVGLRFELDGHFTGDDGGFGFDKGDLLLSTGVTFNIHRSRKRHP